MVSEGLYPKTADQFVLKLNIMIHCQFAHYWLTQVPRPAAEIFLAMKVLDTSRGAPL